jgi:hypothetical protein
LTQRYIPAYPQVMNTDPQEYTKWSDRLALDIALRLEGSGEDLAEICLRHNIVPATLLVYNKDPVFLAKVGHLRNEVRDKGITFKLKARTQAEELLKTSWLLIHSPETSAAVKADLIKSTVKWAGLEPKGDAIAEDGNGGGIRIMINLGGNNAAPKVIEGNAVEEAA